MLCDTSTYSSAWSRSPASIKSGTISRRSIAASALFSVRESSRLKLAWSSVLHDDLKRPLHAHQ